MVIAVTGSTGGMGSNLCERLAAKGTDLALCSIDAEKLAVQANELADKYGIRVYAAAFNIFDDSAVSSFFNEVEEKLGKIKALVNLAGLSIPTKMETVDPDDFDTMMNVNVKGTLLASKYFALHAVPEKALIVNIGSMAARKANGNAPLYCTAKSAVNMLSAGMQIQLGEKDIRVTTVNPGGADTPFWGTRPVDRSKLMAANEVVDVILFILEHDNIVVYSIDFESATRIK